MIARKNVLLLSAGRRVELLQAFRRELTTRSMSATLYAGDLNPTLSAACQLADSSIVLPRATSSGYVDHLLDVCVERDIGLVIPTIDTELLGLAQVRSRFDCEGVHLMISDEQLVSQCRDKRRTSLLFRDLGIGVPRILDRHQLLFPCFAKPFDGSRSVGAIKLTSLSDLTDKILSNDKLMFMEYIGQPYDEYTVDAYFDRSGDLRCLVPRHRLEVRDGEISKGVTRKNHVYNYLRDHLAGLRGARGCLTIQLFADDKSKRYAALEINPRFGGGYPLSYAAGANYPGWLIDEYLLEKHIPFFDAWEQDLLMLRYDAQTLTHNYV